MGTTIHFHLASPLLMEPVVKHKTEQANVEIGDEVWVKPPIARCTTEWRKGRPPPSRASASTVRCIVMQMSYFTAFCSRAAAIRSSESRMLLYSRANNVWSHQSNCSKVTRWRLIHTSIVNLSPQHYHLTITSFA